VPGYISADGTTGAAVRFFDIANVVKVFNHPKTYSFTIGTGSHGSSTPPPAPQIIWFWYSDPANVNVSNAAMISATGNIATQTFLDISYNFSAGQYYVLDRTVAANPVAVSNYGETTFSVCSMYEAAGVGYGYPFGFPNGFTTEAAASAFLAIYQGLGFTASAIFPWAISPPPPPGSAECSWTIAVKAWRRTTKFFIDHTGYIVSAMKPAAHGRFVAAKPLWGKTLNSHGNNPKSCVTTITVVPRSMFLTETQKFS